MVDITCGNATLYARTSHGDCFAWGSGGQGQLGVGGSTKANAKPQRLPCAHQVLQVAGSAGGNFGAAVDSHGRVLTFGAGGWPLGACIWCFWYSQQALCIPHPSPRMPPLTAWKGQGLRQQPSEATWSGGAVLELLITGMQVVSKPGAAAFIPSGSHALTHMRIVRDPSIIGVPWHAGVSLRTCMSVGRLCCLHTRLSPALHWLPMPCQAVSGQHLVIQHCPHGS